MRLVPVLMLAMALPSAAATRVQIASAPGCERALREALQRSHDVELVTAAPELSVVLRGTQLTVGKSDGSTVLERTFGSTTDCRELAFAAALVIERYVRGIEVRAPAFVLPLPLPVPDAGAPRPRVRERVDAGEPAVVVVVVDAGVPDPEPEPEPVPEPEPEPEPVPVVVDAGAPLPVVTLDALPPPPPPRPLLTRFEISASAGADLSTDGAHARFGGDVSVFFSSVRAGLLVQGSTSDRTPVAIDSVTRGSIELQAFSAMLHGGYCLGRTLRGCGSLQAGARLTRGSTSGDFLFQSTTALLWRPSFALELQLAWLPVRSLVLGLALAGIVNPVSGELTVEGVPSATRRVPTVEGQLRFSAGFGVDR